MEPWPAARSSSAGRCESTASHGVGAGGRMGTTERVGAVAQRPTAHSSRAGQSSGEFSGIMTVAFDCAANRA